MARGPQRWAGIWAAVGSAAVAASAAMLTAVTFPALALGIFLAGVLLPAHLGLLRRMVLGAVVYEASLLAMATILAPTGWAAHPRLLSAVLVTVLGVVAGIRGPWSLRPYLRPGDRTAAGLAALAFAVLAVPTVQGDPGDLVTRLSFGADNANHLNIIRAVQTAERFVYNDPPHGLTIGSEAYPQGLALGAGYTTWLIRGGLEPPALLTFVRDVAVALAALFASLVFFGVLLLRELLRRRVAPPRLPTATLTAGVLLTGFILTGPGIVVEAFGFQTQIVATAAILALLWVVTAEDLDRDPSLVLVTTAALLMAVAHSWYLLLPVPLAVLAGYGLRQRRRISWPAWLVTGLLLALSSYPILNGPGGGHVAVDGAVVRLPLLAFAPLALAGVAQRVFRAPGEPAPHGGYVSVAAAAAGLLCLGLAVQQLVGQGSLTYYFWKSLYVVALLLAVLAVVAVTATVVAGRRPLAWGLLALLVLSWSATADYAVPYAFGHRDGPAAGEVVRAALTAYPHGAPPGTDVVASRCDPEEAAHTSWWLGGLLLEWTPERIALHRREDGGRYTTQHLRRYATAHRQLSVVSYIEDCTGSEPLERDLPDNLTVLAAP